MPSPDTHKHRPRISLTLKLLAFSAILGACASSSFFVSYPSQMAPYKNEIVQGDAENSFQKLSQKGSGPNRSLDVLESARIAQIGKNYSESKIQFQKAFDLFNDQDNKAKLDLSDGGSLLSSFALNDNALPYRAEAYERILAYQYQSMNYLAEGDIQGALVEVRRANEEQVLALEDHHKELAKAEKEADSKGLSPDLKDYQARMQENFNTAAKVKNSFQNAYTFYYSGLVREAAGETNGAYIDYKKALEIFPNNVYIQQDVWRLAKLLNMRSDLEKYQTLIKAENKKTDIKPEAGEIVVFFEQGFVPPKQEISLPFSSYTKIYSIAFPAYLNPWHPGSTIKVNAGDQHLGHTNDILDVHALAAKALEEGSFKRLLRQMIRLSTKARIQQEAINQNDGGFAQLLSNAYSFVSERADLRSWLSLPDKVQLGRYEIPAGSHKIQFSNATFSQTINVNISAGQRILIRVNHVGMQSVYVEQFSL